jgi:hypothetical protein
MSDNPPMDELDEIRRLRAMAQLFRKGLAKIHPMPARDRALIDAAFSKTQGITKATPTQAASKKGTVVPFRRKSVPKEQTKQSQTKKEGPSHSH